MERQLISSDGRPVHHWTIHPLTNPLVAAPPPLERFVKVAQRIELPPTSETNVLISCGLLGTHFLESRDKLYFKRKIALSNGVVDCVADKPFVVRVANLGRLPQDLIKHQRIVTAIAAPDTACLIEFASEPEGNHPASHLEEGEGLSNSELENSEETSSVPLKSIENSKSTKETIRASESDMSKGALLPSARVTRGIGTLLNSTSTRVQTSIRIDPNLLEENEEVQEDKTISSPEGEKHLTVEDIPLDHLTKCGQVKARNMLGKFVSMWQGQLGQINTGVSHRIDLLPDSRPVFSQPRRAGPAGREAEEAEVKKMLDLKVIEPATTE